MKTDLVTTSTTINIEDGQEVQKQNRLSLEPSNHLEVFKERNHELTQLSILEEKCQFNLNQLYKEWKSNGKGKSTICIPAAIEVNKKWFTSTLDENTTDYDRARVENQWGNIKGDNAERVVHQAFQRSTTGGILIQGLDYGTLWKKLEEKGSGISLETLQKLKPKSRKDMFEIDFLLFHPIFGIIVMECKAFDVSKNYPIEVCKKAMRQARQAGQQLLTVFKLLTGIELPSEIVHFVLCLPNLEKENIDAIEHCDILDQQDFKENGRFEAFWEEKIAKLEAASTNYFENALFCRLLALTFGFRSAVFISLPYNSLEIFRKIDSQESNKPVKGTISNSTNNAKFELENKIIFMNSEQLEAYNRTKDEQEIRNMLLFGPPGSGKTLLIQILAKEASEIEYDDDRSSRVVVLLAYPELVILYENFFKANKKKQKRAIVINPTMAELERSLAPDSFDDIFADEIFYGGWIPRTRRTNGSIVVGVTIGRQYEKSRIAFAKKNLEDRLANLNFCFVELKKVMRNTRNICDYYKKFEEEPNDDQFAIGHNIQGSSVIEITRSNAKSALGEVVYRIKQYLQTIDEDSTKGSDCRCCLPTDLAVLVAHEPVSSQISLIKSMLEEAGIETGSVAEQLMAKENQRAIVAVDCSANVLSYEWPVVFVINATNCPFSENIANPIVSCSRAVSTLIVVNTGECKYPYLRFFCQAIFPHFLFNFFQKQDSFHFNDIVGEINLNRSRRLVFQGIFWLNWASTFIGIPILLLLDLFIFWFHTKYDNNLADIIFSAFAFIVVLLCFISAVVSFKDYKQCTAILVDLEIIFSLSTLIAVIFSSLDTARRYLITSIFVFGLCFLLIHVATCLYRLEMLKRDWTGHYFKKSKYTIILFYILTHSLSVIFILSLLFVNILNFIINHSYITDPIILLLLSPMQFNIFKLSFRAKTLKSILIQPC